MSKGEYGTHSQGRDHITPPPLDDTSIRRDEKQAAEEASQVQQQASEEPVEEELKDLVEDPAPEPGRGATEHCCLGTEFCCLATEVCYLAKLA